MKGEPVPDADHISRLCGGSQVKSDGTISGSAFLLRKRVPIESSLSVNWLEFLKKHDRNVEVNEIRKVLSKKLTLGSNARIAVLNVGEMRNHVQQNSEDKRVLRALHEPSDNDPSHSGIYDLKLDDDLIADLIAQTIKESHPAKAP